MYSTLRQGIRLAGSIFVCLLPHTLCLQAAEHWISLTTPHFEMYTTNGVKQGTAALQIFEQVRYFFLRFSTKFAPDSRVRIIAFRSENEYKPYRFNEGTFAYYLRSPKQDYIVMQDISSEHHSAAIHEYTHLIVENLNLKLPIWLNEGLADLFSSLEPKGDQARVGRLLPERLISLSRERWLELPKLLSVDRNSPYYNERDKMSIFYAQSWALTHMLVLGKEYRPNFSKFLEAIALDKKEEDSFRLIYGKTLKQVNDDLRDYFQHGTISLLFDIHLEKSDLEPIVAELSELQTRLALTDLLAANQKTATQAQARLEELAKEHPENAEIEESLGYLNWQQRNTDQARFHFARAVERGSKDPEMLYHYSQLLREASGPNSQVVTLLQRALAAKPSYYDAQFALGMAAMSEQKYGLALATLRTIKTVKPEHAYHVFSALAFSALKLKDPKQAKELGEKAKQYATSPDQQLQADNFLRYLKELEQPVVPQQVSQVAASSPPPPTPEPDHNVDRGSIKSQLIGLRHVEGMIKYFDCSGKMQLIRLEVDSKEMIFAIDDPKLVIIRNGKNYYLDFDCGPQKPARLGISYLPYTNNRGIAGKIRELTLPEH